MRDLVDARSPWPIRMPLADRDQHQCGLRGLFIADEHRPPLAGGLRNVELHAASEAGPIVAFLFTTSKPLARSTVAAQLTYDWLDRCSSRLRAAREILRWHPIINSNFKARTRARAHGRYPSPSVGSDPKCRSKSSGLIGLVPVRLRISSMEVALEGHSGAKISLTCAASSSVIESICACSSDFVMT